MERTLKEPVIKPATISKKANKCKNSSSKSKAVLEPFEFSFDIPKPTKSVSSNKKSYAVQKSRKDGSVSQSQPPLIPPKVNTVNDATRLTARNLSKPTKRLKPYSVDHVKSIMDLQLVKTGRYTASVQESWKLAPKKCEQKKLGILVDCPKKRNLDSAQALSKKSGANTVVEPTQKLNLNFKIPKKVRVRGLQKKKVTFALDNKQHPLMPEANEPSSHNARLTPAAEKTLTSYALYKTCKRLENLEIGKICSELKNHTNIFEEVKKPSMPVVYTKDMGKPKLLYNQWLNMKFNEKANLVVVPVKEDANSFYGAISISRFGKDFANAIRLTELKYIANNKSKINKYQKDLEFSFNNLLKQSKSKSADVLGVGEANALFASDIFQRPVIICNAFQPTKHYYYSSSELNEHKQPLCLLYNGRDGSHFDAILPTSHRVNLYDEFPANSNLRVELFMDIKSEYQTKEQESAALPELDASISQFEVERDSVQCEVSKETNSQGIAITVDPQLLEEEFAPPLPPRKEMQTTYQSNGQATDHEQSQTCVYDESATTISNSNKTLMQEKTQINDQNKSLNQDYLQVELSPEGPTGDTCDNLWDSFCSENSLDDLDLDCEELLPDGRLLYGVDMQSIISAMEEPVNHSDLESQLILPSKGITAKTLVDTHLSVSVGSTKNVTKEQMLEHKQAIANIETLLQKYDFKKVFHDIKYMSTDLLEVELQKYTEIFDSIDKLQNCTPFVLSNQVPTTSKQETLPDNVQRKFQVLNAEADNNCFYNALSISICGKSHLSSALRLSVLDHIVKNKEKIQEANAQTSIGWELSAEKQIEQVKLISDGRGWGGDDEAIFASEILKRPIIFYDKAAPTQHLYFNTNPSCADNQPIYLLYNLNHYDAMIPLTNVNTTDGVLGKPIDNTFALNKLYHPVTREKMDDPNTGANSKSQQPAHAEQGPWMDTTQTNKVKQSANKTSKGIQEINNMRGNLPDYRSTDMQKPSPPKLPPKPLHMANSNLKKPAKHLIKSDFTAPKIPPRVHDFSSPSMQPKVVLKRIPSTLKDVEFTAPKIPPRVHDPSSRSMQPEVVLERIPSTLKDVTFTAPKIPPRGHDPSSPSLQPKVVLQRIPNTLNDVKMYLKSKGMSTKSISDAMKWLSGSTSASETAGSTGSEPQDIRTLDVVAQEHDVDINTSATMVCMKCPYCTSKCLRKLGKKKHVAVCPKLKGQQKTAVLNKHEVWESVLGQPDMLDSEKPPGKRGPKRKSKAQRIYKQDYSTKRKHE